MSEKKNIDRLFQEKFKDFEDNPPEYVWENIYDVLREKKKRRVIPLWWRYGGVAALFVLGTLFSLPYLERFNTNENPVVNGPQQEAIPGSKIVKPGVIQDDANGSDGNDAVQFNNDAVAGTANDNTKAGSVAGNGADRANPQSGGTITTPNKALSNGSDSNAVVGTEGNIDAKKQRKASTTRTRGVIKDDSQNAVAALGSDKNNRQPKPGNNGNSTVNVSGSNYNTANRNGAVSTTGQNINSNSGQTVNNQTAIAGNEAGSDIQRKSQSNNMGGVNANIAVIDSITNHAIAEAVTDTTKIKPENELEKLLKEQQEGRKDEQVADNSGGKWSIKPQLAPVFYNSLSQGSPIDGQFASNTKSFDNDLSIGVGVNYAVSERLRIRSGINTVNLSYSTQGVEFYASLDNGTNNVSTAKSANIVVQSQGSTGINPTNAFSSQLSSSNAFAGSMIQQTGYVELPVEMSYALLDKKFGIEVIGGVSTLFLNQNSVSVVSTQGLSTHVGEAQNLNNIHFSTNVGLGFRYRFFKAFEASFEPTFKYQVNTFSRDAGNFKPYFVGLYSGISFSF